MGTNPQLHPDTLKRALPKSLPSPTESRMDPPASRRKRRSPENCACNGCHVVGFLTREMHRQWFAQDHSALIVSQRSKTHRRLKRSMRKITDTEMKSWSVSRHAPCNSDGKFFMSSTAIQGITLQRKRKAPKQFLPER